MSVLAPEPFHPAGGVHQLLFAGEERMALGADLHSDLVLGGAGDELVTAGAAYRGLSEFGMDICFHSSVPILFSNSNINFNPKFSKSHGKINLNRLAGNGGIAEQAKSSGSEGTIETNKIAGGCVSRSFIGA
jgi:hypothetical protein